MEGLALALGITVLGVLADAAWALARVAVSVGLIVAATFGVAAVVFSDELAALVGLVAYAVVLALVRPRGVREAWTYVRELR